jgi:hypothetical protein
MMYRPIKKLLTVQDSMYLRLYPELARFKDTNDRNEALTRYRRKLTLSPWFFLGWLYFLVAAGIPCYFFFFHYLGLPSPNPNLSLSHKLWVYGGFILWADLFAIGAFFLAKIPLVFLTRERVQKYLRQELHKRDVPICLHCGYNLTGCQSAQCPECGTVIPRPPPL